MSVRFSCPHCLSALTVDSRFAGRRGRCPNCKTKLDVPELEVQESVAAASQLSEEKDSAANRSAPGAERVASESGPETDPTRIRQREEQELDELLSRRRGSSGNKGSRGQSQRAIQNAALSTAIVSLPRWVVYAQGALLGIVATTFFIFGMAVGNSTSLPNSTFEAVAGNCVVRGAIYYDRSRERLADEGAVVILLPVEKVPRERPAAEGLRPAEFEPVRNPAIEMIRGMDGAIVRANQDGQFETELPSNTTYWLLVISRNKASADDYIGKQTRAEMGTYFLPIESVLSDRAFMWQKVRLSGATQKLETVNF